MKDKTIEELLAIVDEAYEEYATADVSFSLPDFEEAVRELTLRERE